MNDELAPLTKGEIRELWYGKLNCCGCFENELVFDALRSDLSRIKEGYNKSPDYLRLALYDHAGLIEHGVSARGAFLLGLGVRFLVWLNSDTNENLNTILENINE